MTLQHMMLQDEPLDYEALVEEYNKNLFLVLRGHRSAEYLDTWVPDENPFKGVLNMIEAAELTGTAEIAIRLGASTLKTLDLPALESAAARYPAFRVAPSAATTPSSCASPISREHPSRYLKPRSHPRIKPPSRPPLQVPSTAANSSAVRTAKVFETTVDGITLTIRLHTRARSSPKPRITAPRSLATTAVLDVFCEELAGMTVQEAAEHGVVRLEYRMRANARQRPVPGIVLPRNADTMFDLPARLIRSLAAVYREKTGKAFGENNFMRRVDAAWLHLSDEEKIARAGAVLAERITSLGLLDDDVRVIAVEQQVRLTIAFRESVAVQKKPLVYPRFRTRSSRDDRTVAASFHERSQRRERVAPPVALRKEYRKHYERNDRSHRTDPRRHQDFLASRSHPRLGAWRAYRPDHDRHGADARVQFRLPLLLRDAAGKRPAGHRSR